MINANDLIGIFQKALDEKWGYIWGKTHEMWTEAKQKDYYDKYHNDVNRKLSAENGGKWIGHWVTDCSGLFAYAFKTLGGEMAHGSNTMFLKWCTANGELSGGKRTDGKMLKPGTAVFCYDEEKKNYSHVGLYIGKTYVIEAAGSSQGVIRSSITNKKWKYWGELKGVSFEEKADESAEKPTLRKGDKGSFVMLLQTALLNKGYKLPKYGADGDFGNETLKAVKEFQADHKLTTDGVVGEKTWAALDTDGETRKLYTVTLNGLTKEQAEGLMKQYAGTMAVEK